MKRLEFMFGLASAGRWFHGCFWLNRAFSYLLLTQNSELENLA